MAADFYSFWQRLVGSNEKLAEVDNKMTISVASFRVQMERAYRQGDADGVARERALNKILNKGNDKSLFGGIFGGL